MNYNWENINDALFGILEGEDVTVMLFDKDNNRTIKIEDATRFFVTRPSIDLNKTDLLNYSILVTIVDDGILSKIQIKSPKKEIIGNKNFIVIRDIVNHIRKSIGKKESLHVEWKTFNKDITPKFGIVSEQIAEHRELYDFLDQFADNKILKEQNAEDNYIRSTYKLLDNNLEQTMSFLMGEYAGSWTSLYQKDPEYAMAKLRNIVDDTE